MISAPTARVQDLPAAMMAMMSTSDLMVTSQMAGFANCGLDRTLVLAVAVLKPMRDTRAGAG